MVIRTTTIACSTPSASSRAFEMSASTVLITHGRSKAGSESVTSSCQLPVASCQMTRDQAIEFVARERSRGHTIVFTNGVFDILHPGHIRYLRDARALGDLLIVGVNSDRSVKALAKAPDRPINSENERAEVLAALASVDAVVIFDEDTPHEIISALQPDILVKGADWGENAIVGRDIVEARGGKVVRIALAEGYSTTRLLDRVRGQLK